MNLQQALEIWNLESKDFTTTTDYQVEIVAIALDLDPEDVYDWTLPRLRDEYNRVLLQLNAVQRAPKSIRILGQDLHLLPFAKLTLGAFIDLEHYCSSNESILEVCSILYRIKKENIWESDEWDVYDNWVTKRKDYFREAPLAVAACKLEYIRWREDVTRQYSGLFEIPYDDEGEESDLSPIEREKLKREEAKAKAFSWEATLLTLANGNAAYVPKILEMPVLLAFNLLSSLKIHSK